jgi:uncharacterized spore protein YtfJ
MDITSTLEKTGSSLTAKRVFSEPIERDGAMVILAASVGGGGGGGEGHTTPEGKHEGAGGGIGYGFGAKPAGAFIIKDGRVRWQPAVDVNRIILGAQLVMAWAFLMTSRARLRSRQALVRSFFGRRALGRKRRWFRLTRH